MDGYYKKVEMKTWTNENFYDDWTIQNENGLCPVKIKGRKPLKVAYLSFMMRMQNFYSNVKYENDFSISSKMVKFWFGGRMGTGTIINYLNFFEELNIIEDKGVIRFKGSRFDSNVFHVNMNKAYEWLKDYAGVIYVDLDTSRIYEFFDNSKQYYKKLKEDAKVESMTIEEQAEYFEKEAKKEEKTKKKKEKLKKDNEPFLNILNELETYGLDLRYINQGSRRLTSQICNTRNEQHEGSTRISEIQRLWNTNEDIIEFDTNASIYRLSYLLGHKTACSHDIDIYEEIFKRCNFKYIGEWKDIRKDFKQLFMPIYMKEGSIKWTNNDFEFKKKWTFFYNSKVKEQVDFYNSLLERLHCDSLYDLMTNVRDSMKDYLNMIKFERANIFIYESNLHILMLKKFQDLGIKVINVYDGFYFEKGQMTQELFDSIYDECSLELLNIMKLIEVKNKNAKRKTNKIRTA